MVARFTADELELTAAIASLLDERMEPHDAAWCADAAEAVMDLLRRDAWLERTELSRVRRATADLDRCEHGRHAVDNCFGCPDGWSTGNLFLEDGQRIGTTLYGEAIAVEKVRRHERGT